MVDMTGHGKALSSIDIEIPLISVVREECATNRP